jgi:hypothetical protein
MTRRRLVVALEAGIPDPELEAAVALARSLDAELLGLFVEDLDLLRFAALPFAHEIGTASAARRRLDPAALERDLRAHALEAERRLSGVASRVQVPSAFRVARGVAHVELLAAAATEAARDVLRLLLLGDGESPATRWAEEARARLAQEASAWRLDLVLAADLAELGDALHAGLPGVVVLRGDPAVLAQRGLPDLLRASAMPVLVLPRRAALPRRT